MKSRILEELKKSTLTAVWFVLLTLPIMAMQVDITAEWVDEIVTWHWDNLIWVAGVTFFGSAVWRYFLTQRSLKKRSSHPLTQYLNLEYLVHHPKMALPSMIVVLGFLLITPLLFSSYQMSIITTALMYVVLGLGLNIVVGLAGLLDLGYVAFYAVGAYSYALLNLHFGFGFWAVLPIAGCLAALFGILLGIPVLRLRGDYLAIVTLGFGEIIRLVLENWSSITQGPRGVPNIPQAQPPGVELTFEQTDTFMYYLMVVMAVFTIFVVRRLGHSRIGRAWIALREDELACQAMGIDTTKTKLRAFALGATWAGFVGVFFAAKNTFVNPASFTFHQSAIILCIVVLGGMGSIVGVILAAVILILLPEYLRFLQDYRMLVFGAVMIVMMVFRPEGLISNVRQSYDLPEELPETTQ